ncbi:MAG: hypothetical protein WC378_19960, partial [Opitutaceae bacterium]|jgi:hypothetical protein
MPDDLLRDLRETADAQPDKPEPAELLRRATVALVECHKRLGKIPMDMRLTQETVYEHSEPPQLMVAEPTLAESRKGKARKR